MGAERMEVQVVCPDCDGEGLDDEGMFECRICSGEKSLPARLVDPEAVLTQMLAARLLEFNDSPVIYVATGDDGNGPTVRVSKAHLFSLLAPASPEEKP